jgi:hypothetical protein
MDNIAMPSMGNLVGKQIRENLLSVEAGKIGLSTAPEDNELAVLATETNRILLSGIQAQQQLALYSQQTAQNTAKLAGMPMTAPASAPLGGVAPAGAGGLFSVADKMSMRGKPDPLGKMISESQAFTTGQVEMGTERRAKYRALMESSRNAPKSKPGSMEYGEAQFGLPGYPSGVPQYFPKMPDINPMKQINDDMMKSLMKPIGKSSGNFNVKDKMSYGEKEKAGTFQQDFNNLIGGLNAFGTKLTSIADLFKGLEVQHKGNFDVVVQILGAQMFQNLMPSIQTLISETVKKSINVMLAQKFALPPMD